MGALLNIISRPGVLLGPYENKVISQQESTQIWVCGWDTAIWFDPYRSAEGCIDKHFGHKTSISGEKGYRGKGYIQIKVKISLMHITE